MGVVVEHSWKCCGAILSLVQFLFSFVNNRITKFFFSWKGCFSHSVFYVFTWRCKTDHVIYQTRERVFHQDIQTPRSGLKKRGAAEFFLTEFEVFGYLMKHSFEFLIWLLKPFTILGEIQSKSLQNFMLIKTRFPNLRHGSDFLCFLFMNY